MSKHPTPTFTYDTTIQLPGTLGGHGDWVTYDPATQTVWLAQSPDNEVVVIDARTNTVKATIPGVNNGNGIAITPQYAFVADPVKNVVDVIDKHTYQIVGTVAATGTNLDGVVYAPNVGEVFVASDDANVLDAISIQNGFTQTASYALTPSASGPDVPIYAKGMIYVPDGQVVDAVNPTTGSVVATSPLVSSGVVKPGVYDPVTNRFFFGSTDKEIVVVSGSGATGIGNAVGTIAISGSTDEGAIDVKARLAFFGSSAGVVDVVNLDTTKLVATLPAETGMHTLTVDTRTHQLYVYENNRNVVDVWNYTKGGDRMSFIAGAHGEAGLAGDVSAAAGTLADLLRSAHDARPPQPALNGRAGGAAMTSDGSHVGSSLLAGLDHINVGNVLPAGFGHGS